MKFDVTLSVPANRFPIRGLLKGAASQRISKRLSRSKAVALVGAGPQCPGEGPYSDLEGAPATTRSLSTLKTPGAELACM